MDRQASPFALMRHVTHIVSLRARNWESLWRNMSIYKLSHISAEAERGRGGEGVVIPVFSPLPDLKSGGGGA